jgi:hypothetical protein
MMSSIDTQIIDIENNINATLLHKSNEPLCGKICYYCIYLLFFFTIITCIILFCIYTIKS